MKSSLVRKVIIDVICLGIVWLPALLFEVIGQPFQRGFFCDDTSIRYPYHDSTVTSAVLFIYSIGLPIFFIIGVESFRWRQNSDSRRLGRQSTSSSLNISSDPSSAVIAKILHLIGVFLFGAACCELATDSAKYSVGRLRPHFLDVCMPISLDGSELCPLNGPPKYITNYTCTGTNEHRLKDARLSFPSGHASFSAYGMVFLALYLQSRMNWSGSKLFRPTIQIAVLILSWYTGLSRIFDYKHHGDDVFVGFIIGITAASLTALYVSTLFKPNIRYEKGLSTQPRPIMGIEQNSNLPTSASTSAINIPTEDK